MHKNIKLIVSYFGRPFVGWQKTKMGPSVEETLEAALRKVLQQDVELQAASRTDAGVHAEAQVVTFFLEKDFCLQTLQFRLNCLLPNDISILEADEMPAAFHPTLHAVGKEYAYEICHAPIQLPFHRHTSWHFPYLLDTSRMQSEAQFLLGTHDFSAFCNERKLWERNTVCTLEKIDIEEVGQERVKITIMGDRFLFRMARNIVGTLAYVGCGKLEPNCLKKILESKDRTQAGVTAPACGLKLKQVFYDPAQ